MLAWFRQTGRKAALWVCTLSVLALAYHLGPRDVRGLLAWPLARFYFVHMTWWHNTISTRVWIKDMNFLYGKVPWAFIEPTFQFKPGYDHTAQVCLLSVYAKFAEELHAGIIVSPLTDQRVTLRPDQRIDAYLEACREVVGTLPEEQRNILEALDPVPPPWQFHLNVTHAWMNGVWTNSMWEGRDSERFMQKPLGKEVPEGFWDTWRANRQLRADELPSLAHRRKSLEELRDLPPKILEGFRQLDFWPVRDERVEVEKIPRALQEGRTVVFDATKLCGKDVFNLTIPDIARLHGPLANEIPVFKQESAAIGDNTYDTLLEAGHRWQTWNDLGWQSFPDFGPFVDYREVFARDVANTPRDWLTDALDIFLGWWLGVPRESVRESMTRELMKYRQSNTQTTINVKRLPRFPLQDMYKAMGSPDWVDRLWNLLWIGPVSDFWHFDEEDNLLIAISGTLYVAVSEQNFTDLMSGTRNVGLGFNDIEGFFRYRVPGQTHWIDRNPWVRKVPIHFLKLEPGMGITVPSRTYHNVMALDGNRVLMNCFFFPKWRAAEKFPAGEHSWYRPGSQADTFRAMWHLKSKTLWRMWDTRRIGGFFAGYKLEFF